MITRRRFTDKIIPTSRGPVLLREEEYYTVNILEPIDGREMIEVRYILDRPSQFRQHEIKTPPKYQLTLVITHTPTGESFTFPLEAEGDAIYYMSQVVKHNDIPRNELEQEIITGEEQSK